MDRMMKAHILVQDAGAAKPLDEATKLLARELDKHDTDESGERLETQLADAIRDAVVEVAERHGWRPRW
jgi:hypothetical protein